MKLLMGSADVGVLRMPPALRMLTLVLLPPNRQAVPRMHRMCHWLLFPPVLCSIVVAAGAAMSVVLPRIDGNLAKI